MNNEYKELAGLSEKLIERQIASYRHKQSCTSFLITMIALFIPFFISGIDDATALIKSWIWLPVIILFVALLALIAVLWLAPLKQGVDMQSTFDFALDSLSHDEILKAEIEANYLSYYINSGVIRISNIFYRSAVIATAIGIVISGIILVYNQQNTQDKTPYKIEIVNFKDMADKPSKNHTEDIKGTNQPSNDPTTQRRLSDKIDRTKLATLTDSSKVIFKKKGNN